MKLIETLLGLSEHQKAIEECKTNPKAIGRLIGVARKLDPKADPKKVKEALYQHFGHEVEVKQKSQEEVVIRTTLYIDKLTGERVRKAFAFDPRPWSQKEADKQKGMRYSPQVIRYYLKEGSGPKPEYGQMNDLLFHHSFDQYLVTKVYYPDGTVEEQLFWKGEHV